MLVTLPREKPLSFLFFISYFLAFSFSHLIITPFYFGRINIYSLIIFELNHHFHWKHFPIPWLGQACPMQSLLEPISKNSSYQNCHFMFIWLFCFSSLQTTRSTVSVSTQHFMFLIWSNAYIQTKWLRESVNKYVPNFKAPCDLPKTLLYEWNVGFSLGWAWGELKRPYFYSNHSLLWLYLIAQTMRWIKILLWIFIRAFRVNSTPCFTVSQKGEKHEFFPSFFILHWKNRYAESYILSLK